MREEKGIEHLKTTGNNKSLCVYGRQMTEIFQTLGGSMTTRSLSCGIDCMTNLFSLNKVMMSVAANISKFQSVMKPTATNCPLVFEAFFQDSTLNTRRMLKLFSLPIARGGRHDETVGSLLVPVPSHKLVPRQTAY